MFSVHQEWYLISITIFGYFTIMLWHFLCKFDFVLYIQMFIVRVCVPHRADYFAVRWGSRGIPMQII